MDNGTIILNIVKASIMEQKIDCAENISFDVLLSLAQKHKIITMVYYVIYNCGIELPDDIKKTFQQIVMAEVMISEQQMYYVKKISEEFCKANIDHMLLKGSVLKELYPKPEIRRMGDIDILIKEEQYPLVSKIMENLGFSFKKETNHEIIWLKDNIMIELHKILVPSYNKDFHAYLGNGWDRAVKTEGSRYIFEKNDMFVHLFIHFAKHYRDTGIGIIHMCDLYMYMKANNLDFDYIEEQLRKLELYDFYCNVRNTIAVWFEDKESNEMTDYITSVILNSGVYGIYENRAISSALKGKVNYGSNSRGRIKKIIRTIFPALETMRFGYGVLKKFPVLLPVFWAWRLLSKPFTKTEGMKARLKEMKGVDDNVVDSYEKALEYVGLKYNFK